MGCLLAVLSLAGRAALLPWIPMPKPGIQDEFSYLLAADTLAAGRLTNPMHPLWVHFETMHELVRPTYQSKYPPLQGLILATGQVIFGNPWFGVWLSIGVMCAAIYWALCGWLPPKWALLGGVLALLRVGFLNYWSESYWGGAATAIGGALIVGAVPRLRRRAEWKCGVILGVGLAMLAISRPFEGLLLAVGCVAALVKIRWHLIAAPLATVLIPVALWMGYYNFRVTGNLFELPYVAHERQYATWSPFIWNTHPRPAPHYNHEALGTAWIGWEEAHRYTERAHPWQRRWWDFVVNHHFYLGSPLTLCALGFAFIIFRKQPKLRPAVLIAVWFLLAAETETFLWPHYLAPATALFYTVAISALRRLRHFSLIAAVLVILATLALDFGGYTRPENRFLFDKRDFIAHRDSILEKLRRQPGEHLVLVSFGPEHDLNHEWVYNRAKIDNAHIVWAREMGDQKDAELLRYYAGRKVWRLFDNGAKGVTLSPLPHPK